MPRWTGGRRRLDPDRHDKNEDDDVPDPAQGLGADQVLQSHRFPQAERLPQQQSEDSTENHDTEAAELNQDQDDDLPQKGEVLPRVLDGQAGHANLRLRPAALAATDCGCSSCS